MRPTLRAAVAIAAAAWAAAAEVQAQQAWTVVAQDSALAFAFVLNGAPRQGRFTRFEGVGTFDPDDLSTARLELVIDVASLDLGDALETDFALSAEWFDANDHPTARYRLVQLTPSPDGRYEALGDLRIKERLEILRTPVALSFEGDRARAVGALRFDRRDFAIGTGPSSLFLSVDAEVSVDFDIVAVRATAGD